MPTRRRSLPRSPSSRSRSGPPTGPSYRADGIPRPGPKVTGRDVLLLHGFADNASAWETSRVSMLNRHGWNVAALDSRAYGNSEGTYRRSGAARWATSGPGSMSWPIAWLDPTPPRRPARALGPVDGGGDRPADRGRGDHRVATLVLESPMVDLDSSVAALLRGKRLPFARPFARLITRRAGRLAGVALNRPRSSTRASVRLRDHRPRDDRHARPHRRGRRLADALASPPRWFDVPGGAYQRHRRRRRRID